MSFATNRGQPGAACRRRVVEEPEEEAALKHAPIDVDSVRPAWPSGCIRMTASVCETSTVANAIFTGVDITCRA